MATAGNTKKTRRFWASIFPPEHDFFGALCEQVAHSLTGIEALLDWMRTGDPAHAERVHQIEHECDQIRAGLEKELHAAFATPIDREDIYHLSRRLDDVVNYAKNTVGEMQIFGIAPEPGMAEMVEILVEGVTALKEGFAHLHNDLMATQEAAKVAKKSERNLEKAYRHHVLSLMESDDIKHILLQREIYRHLSNTGDRIDDVADDLLQVVFKNT